MVERLVRFIGKGHSSGVEVLCNMASRQLSCWHKLMESDCASAQLYAMRIAWLRYETNGWFGRVACND